MSATAFETPETRLSSSLDSVGDAVIVADMAGSVEFLNLAAKILIGVGGQSAIGKPLDEVLHIEEEYSGRPVNNLVELAVLSGSSISLGKGLLLLTRSGQALPVEGEVSARLSSGAPTGAVVTLRDITARNREELQRRERQHLQAVGHLAGSIAHEVNNLLTVVVGHSELLDRRALPEPAHANVASIRHAADGIASVTRQLLSLSGREILFPAVVDLNKLLVSIEGRLRSLLPANMTLVVSCGNGLATVLVDQVKMEQALADLVLHARDRMSLGGAITISTRNAVADATCRARHAQHFVELTVHDEGPPIRGTAAEELFEPSNSKPGRPFSLGLFSLRNLLSASSGHLYLQGRAETGAGIVLLFPQFKEQCPPASEPPGERGEKVPPTILLVEDDDAIRILLTNSLELQGYRVLEGRDGDEGLMQAALCDDPIDLLITDVAMPRMDGATLARRLLTARPTIKVLLISGCVNDLASIRQLLEEGAHYFQKPFSQWALLEWIEANVGAVER